MDTQDKSREFLIKIGQLPEAVGLYLSSSISGEALDALAKKYDLARNDLDELLQDLFLSDFDFSRLDSFAEAEIDVVKTYREFTCDFLGQIFLPLAKSIKIDIAKEIVARGGAEDRYAAAVSSLAVLVEEENNRRLDEMVQRYDTEVDYKEEAVSALYLFSDNLVDVLKNVGSEENVDLNSSLIRLLHKDPSFKNKATQALLENKEKVTVADISVDGKILPPTAANWLKDFMVVNGSDMFNSVALSRYISAGINTKNLSPEEKKMVGNLLKLYRNLVFFPDSLANLPLEDWEIFPTDREALAMARRKGVLAGKPPVTVATPASQPKPVAKASVDAAKLKTADVKKDLAEASLKSKDTQQITNDRFEKIKKLDELANQYPVGSLERKAVDEEIKRLSK